MLDTHLRMSQTSDELQKLRASMVNLIDFHHFKSAKDVRDSFIDVTRDYQHLGYMYGIGIQ